MAFKIATTILLKIVLINFVFIACVCHAKPKKGGGGGSKPAGGSTKPSNPETCTCETFQNLCGGSSMLDLRIANFEDTELVCNLYEYKYCDVPKLGCSHRRIRSNFDLFGTHPWHVNIYDTSKQVKFIGSGVLIKKQYVLTVAHKVIDYVKSGVKLRFGEWDRLLSPTCNTLELKSLKIVTHPEYNTKLHTNNIALIKLDKEVDIAQYPHINTACLASSVPDPGSHCLVAGWGVDMFDPNNVGITGQSSEKLKQVTMPIIGHDKCEQDLRSTRLGHGYKLEKDSFVCAGGELGRDTCTGDGGSPLMCPNAEGVLELVGLTVGGIGCRSTVPGLYTKVPEFKEWIEKAIFQTIDD